LIGTLISLFIIGVIAGYLARLIVPGDDPLSFWMTVGLGVVGSYVGGLLAWAIFERENAFAPTSIIGSVIGAVIVLVVYNALGGRKAHA
jgi:uncharacterized membrane protein YeaQ/YmgE (transglycosylase-associated protein family)